MQRLKPVFFKWDIYSKRVFLRVDANVPMRDGNITDDFRLHKMLPTLDALIQRGASVIVATHIGKPHGYDKSVTTKPIAEWLQKKHYNAFFVPSETTGYAIPQHKAHGHEVGTIYVLDNLRFFDAEKKASQLFAQMLRSYADYFVNDAFGMIHESAASTSVLSQLYDKDHKSIGLLMEEELSALAPFDDHNKKTFFLLGGNKVASKLAFIDPLLKRKNTSVFIGPALSFTFLHAQGYSIGRSLLDETQIDQAKKIMALADQSQATIILPQDYLSIENELLIEHMAHNFPQEAIGATIGPRTLEALKKILPDYEHIVVNCAMGFENKPKTQENTIILLDEINKLQKSYRIVAGGDTNAIAHKHNINNMNWYSTGGGASLAVITHSPLPGIKDF